MTNCSTPKCETCVRECKFQKCIGTFTCVSQNVHQLQEAEFSFFLSLAMLSFTPMKTVVVEFCFQSDDMSFFQSNICHFMSIFNARYSSSFSANYRGSIDSFTFPLKSKTVTVQV